MTTNLIIADDHPIFREGMRRIVERAVPSVVAVEVGTAEALEGVLSRMAVVDMMVLDLMFPGFDYRRDLPSLRVRYPLAIIVVVSMLGDVDEVEAIMATGINGFINKSVPPREMSGAFLAILEGDIVVRTVPQLGEGEEASAGDDGESLSPRQIQVLRLICQGKSNKEIARELDISPYTVRVHVSAVLRALGARSRSAAVAIAARREMLG